MLRLLREYLRYIVQSAEMYYQRFTYTPLYVLLNQSLQVAPTIVSFFFFFFFFFSPLGQVGVISNYC